MAKIARRTMGHVASMRPAEPIVDARQIPGRAAAAQELQRLCDADQRVCQLLLDWLVEVKFLSASSDGRYSRVAPAPRVLALPEKIARSAHARPRTQSQLPQRSSVTCDDPQDESEQECAAVVQSIAEMRSTLAEIIKRFS